MWSSIRSTDGGIFSPSGGGDDDPIGNVTWRIGGARAGGGTSRCGQTHGPDHRASGHTSSPRRVTVFDADDVDLSNDDAPRRDRGGRIVRPERQACRPGGRDRTGSASRLPHQLPDVGTASAINIVVRDTLDANLDISTFRSARPATTTHSRSLGRELIWTFDGIELPDSTSDEPGSHGWVEFTILPRRPELAPGTEIANRAGIYSDFNAVVLTNTVISTIQDPTHAPEGSEVRAASLRLRSIAPANPTRTEPRRFVSPSRSREDSPPTSMPWTEGESGRWPTDR